MKNVQMIKVVTTTNYYDDDNNIIDTYKLSNQDKIRLTLLGKSFSFSIETIVSDWKYKNIKDNDKRFSSYLDDNNLQLSTDNVSYFLRY